MTTTPAAPQSCPVPPAKKPPVASLPPCRVQRARKGGSPPKKQRSDLGDGSDPQSSAMELRRSPPCQGRSPCLIRDGVCVPPSATPVLNKASAARGNKRCRCARAETAQRCLSPHKKKGVSSSPAHRSPVLAPDLPPLRFQAAGGARLRVWGVGGVQLGGVQCGSNRVPPLHRFGGLQGRQQWGGCPALPGVPPNVGPTTGYRVPMVVKPQRDGGGGVPHSPYATSTSKLGGAGGQRLCVCVTPGCL